VDVNDGRRGPTEAADETSSSTIKVVVKVKLIVITVEVEVKLVINAKSN